MINNEDWGVYVNTEQFNTDFIQARFGTRRGARWKVPGSPFGQGGMAYLGDDPKKYKFIYEIKSNDNARLVAGSDRPVQAAQPDAAGEAGGGAGSRCSTLTAC